MSKLKAVGLMLVLPLIVTASSTTASAAPEHHTPKHEKGQRFRASLSETRNRIAAERKATWTCQRALGRSLYRSHQRERQMDSLPYLRYLHRLWRERRRDCRAAYRAWQTSTGLVIRRLDRGLAGSPMAGTGNILERHGRRHRVSPYFMAAVAATESSLGHAACSNNRKNVYGLASCVNSWPVPYFETWEESISFFARFLAQRWPGHSTPYSFQGYAACTECWARKVSYWMQKLFGAPPVTRYP